MAPFKRADKKEFYVKIPVLGGGWKSRSTGTDRSVQANRIDHALKEMHPKHGNKLDTILEAVNSGRVALLELANNPSVRGLQSLQKALEDQGVETLIPEWLADVERRSSKDTRQHYNVALNRFVEHPRSKSDSPNRPLMASHLTVKELQSWLDKAAGSNNTRRKWGAALASFCQFLVRQEKLEVNPMRSVKLPPLDAPRARYLETDDAILLINSMEGDYRCMGALMAGSGVEVSVALGLRVRDVDRKNKEIFAAGTKTHARQRSIRVAGWAWPYVLKAIRNKKPENRLFGQIPNRWSARDAHAAAIDKLIEKGHNHLAGYTMRDHRHTYAVRAIRAGTPAVLVAHQLGHANAVLVNNTYGMHTPRSSERAHWEKIAHGADQTRLKEQKRFGVRRGVRTSGTHKQKSL
jgi:integrase